MNRSVILAAAALIPALSLASAASATQTHKVTPLLYAHVPGKSGIVGTWKAVYDGGVHTAYAQWQKGGTSSQLVDFAPKTGNALLGDWNINGDGSISVFLTGWSYDPKGNNLTGYFTKSETETVTGNTYNGTFEVTFYDLQGNILFQHDGTLSATRISP